MKRLLAVCFVIILLFCSVSCGDVVNGDIETNSTDRIDNSMSSDDLEKLIDDLKSEAKSIISEIEREYDNINEVIGDSFEDYSKNKDLFSELYESIVSKFVSFDELVSEKYNKYYKEAFDLFNEDERKFKRAIDDIYDDVYGILN